jgi:hypothetical protein
MILRQRGSDGALDGQGTSEAQSLSFELSTCFWFIQSARLRNHTQTFIIASPHEKGKNLKVVHECP